MRPESQKASVGIKHLAEIPGISTGTISRALNNRPGVNTRTRAKVIEEARRTGYVANGAARALKDRPVLMIGLFFSPYLGPGREINPAALQFVELFRHEADAQATSLQTIFCNDHADLKAHLHHGQTHQAAFVSVSASDGIEATCYFVEDVTGPSVGTSSM